MITAEELRALVSYDRETGLFTRLKNAKKKGHAGAINNRGYVTISINCKTYRAHRLAWLYVHGYMPEAAFEIDHINGIRHDNRIANLRICTKAENMRNTKRYSNNTSGLKGVHWQKHKRKWESSIRINGKLIHLGRFDTVELAHDAYKMAANKHFGEFKCVTR